MQRAFRRRREEVELVPYDTTLPQFNGPVTEALDEGAQVVAVVGTGTVGARVLAALAANDAPPTEISTFVTSGLRVDNLGALIDPRRPTASAGIKGVSPKARTGRRHVRGGLHRDLARSPDGLRRVRLRLRQPAGARRAGRRFRRRRGDPGRDRLRQRGRIDLPALRPVRRAAGRGPQHQPQRRLGRPRSAGRRRRRGGRLRRVRVRRAGPGRVDRDDHHPARQRVQPSLRWLRRRPAGRPAASPCRRRRDRTRRRWPRPGRSASCRRPP